MKRYTNQPYLILSVCFLALMSVGCEKIPELNEKDLFFHKIKTTKIQSDTSVEWMSVGPGMSGYNEEFWTHPNDVNAMFMGPDMHVSYGTWNNGQSWHTLKDPDGLGQEMKRVLDIEFSLQNPDYAMAIDWNGWVYDSTNRGRSWKKIRELGRSYREVGIEPNDPQSFEQGWYYEQMGTRYSELAVDPTNDNVWYVGAGDFWNVKANHKSAEKPHGNRFLYADYGHLWKTVDKGKSWLKITNGLPEDLDVARIIVNPTNNSNLVMATSHGIMLSQDGGMSWHQHVKGLPHNLPRDLTSFYDSETGEYVLYLVEQTVFEDKGDTVAANGGVYKSVDGGVNWTDVSGNLQIDMTAITSPDEIYRYYRSIAHWFGLSHDQAKDTFSRLPGATLPVFNRIVVNPLNKNEIYLSYNKKHDFTFGPGEVWRTLNGGNTWTVVARHGKYWKSGQDAEYWQSRGNATGTNIGFAHLQEYMDRRAEVSGNRMLVINAQGHLFIGVDQQTLRSTDKGETWFQIDDDETAPGSEKWVGRGGSNLPGRVMLHETGIESRRLLASGEHGLWQTTGPDDWRDNGPVVVEQIEGQNHEDGVHSVSTMAVHPDDPDTLYILAWRQEHRGKLRRTTNGGKSWENIATIFDVESALWRNVATQNSLIIDPDNPQNMYFAATYQRVSEIHNGPGVELSKGGFGFYRSTDGGYSWELKNQGFHEGASVRRLAMHPDNPEVIYAALNDDNGGLYRTKNKGDAWHRLDTPAVIKAVNNVFIDRNNKHVLISTGRNDGSYEEGGVWRSVDNGGTWEQVFIAPFVWQAETSPVNPDLMVISVAGQKVSRADGFMNPGIFLSQDAGESWSKINRNLGQPDKIVDVKPDPFDENILWCAAWGSGWYIAYLNAAGSIE